MTEIKFCENNFSYGTEEVLEQLKNELKNADIEVESCLGYCGICAEKPFALVNGEVVQAETPEELIELIKEQAD